MALRIGFFAVLAGLYFLGTYLVGIAAPIWMLASLMGVVFVALVAAMYLRILPALLALPILAVALAAIAGMEWKNIFTAVIGEGSVRLSNAILAAILGAILAQVVEKTGIAQTAIKKTAELGGDRPMVLAFLLTVVTAILFTALGGLGAVIMVATIVVPILLSLGLRPLYVGCLFLLAMSLGGVINLQNMALYKDTLGMTNSSIFTFAVPFAALMFIAIIVFLFIEGKRMGKARYKAMVTEESDTKSQFVPWYALLTPVVPLVPILFFTLIPWFSTRSPEVTVTPKAKHAEGSVLVLTPVDQANSQSIRIDLAEGASGTYALPWNKQHWFPLLDNDRKVKWEASIELPANTIMVPQPEAFVFDAKAWKSYPLEISFQADSGDMGITMAKDPTSTSYDFPIPVAMLLGIIFGVVTTWRRGESSIQLITKSAFDGVSIVGPAIVLMIGIGMVLKATMSPEVASVITPILKSVVPNPSHGSGLGMAIHYVLLFGLLAPLALYRGPFNMWGMGAGLVGVLQPLLPAGAIMGAFMSVGMIQGVSDPTNTHNVWIANYTKTDVQDILKRTLPYMWILAIIGLILSAVLYYKVI